MTDADKVQYPRRGNGFSRSLGKGFLQMFGWRLTTDFPNVPKGVVIGGPHTSNWDGVFSFAAMMQLGLDAHLMMKDSAFKGPQNGFLRWLGAVPIDRSKAGGVVEQSVAQFNERDKFMLIVAPEGTRGGAKGPATFRAGAFRIAELAQVPIVPIVIYNAGQRLPARGLQLSPGPIMVEILKPVYPGSFGPTPENTAACIREHYIEKLNESADDKAAADPASRGLT